MIGDSSRGSIPAWILIALLLIAAAVFSLPRSHEGRLEEASIAAAKSDLKNLVTAQEAHFANSGQYCAGPLPDTASL